MQSLLDVPNCTPSYMTIRDDWSIKYVLPVQRNPTGAIYRANEAAHFGSADQLYSTFPDQEDIDTWTYHGGFYLHGHTKSASAFAAFGCHFFRAITICIDRSYCS